MADKPEQQKLFPDPSGPHLSGPHPSGPHPSGQATPAPPPVGPAPAPVWLQRLSLFILVIFCIYLGIIVTIVPWWTAVWDHNLYFTSHPALWAILRLGPTRGVISGLGLLDIWIGLSEAIHYRDDRPESARPESARPSSPNDESTHAS